MLRPIPDHVTRGMFIAALARAQHCDLELCAGRMRLRDRYSPSRELTTALRDEREHIVGVLGWAVPTMWVIVGPIAPKRMRAILRRPRSMWPARAFAATWPHYGGD